MVRSSEFAVRSFEVRRRTPLFEASGSFEQGERLQSLRMANIADLIQAAADFLFVPVLVIVLFGTGLFLTVRLGFVQVRRFGEAVRTFFGGRGGTSTGALTPFQAFMTALGTTIGTGN